MLQRPFVTVVIIFITFATLVVAPPRQAHGAGNGKVRQYASTQVAPNTLSAGTPVLTATLAKGIKNNTLVVTGSVDVSYSPQLLNSLEAYVKVNGIGYPDIKPYVYTGAPCAPAVATFSYCNLSHTWWLDLNAAELAHPGVFIGQPLVVELGSYWDGAPPAGGTVTAGLIVELKKNK